LKSESTTKVFHHTQALCPQCRSKVTARIVEQDEKIYLQKFCGDHGFSQALICSDPAWYQESLKYVKPKQNPLQVHTKKFKGCPESCGACPEHQQHTCLPVIEITSTCNLDCPVCLKRFSRPFQLTGGQFEAIIDMLIHCEGRLDVINLSGGEPTLHPQLGDFLRLAKAKGIMQTTVSTNGLRLLSDPGLRQLFRETSTLAALQFDGFNPGIYERLRGRDLSAEKTAIIETLEREDVRYSLVTTVAKGVNDREITKIADFFFRSQAVSLMLQPITLTGAAQSFSVAEKLTIPDVVHALEQCQFVKKGDFNPLPCSHFSCFALAYYFIVDRERFLSLKEFLGMDDYLDAIANKTLPGLDSEGFDLIRSRLYNIWSLADAGSLGEQALKRIRDVLGNACRQGFTPDKAFALGIETMKAVFIHDFMDQNTFDFGRVIKCCNPYPQIDGRLIPMCSQNVFFQEDQHA
jgi:uncharacterized radical SAM superfamily Fe-S cluster-containing enzyme